MSRFEVWSAHVIGVLVGAYFFDVGARSATQSIAGAGVVLVLHWLSNRGKK